MIVEFAGCSGSGKSTLFAELLRHCREHDVPVRTVPQALLRWFPQGVVRQPTLQNLLLDVGGACRRIAACGPHRDFLKFARAAIRRDTDRLWRGVNAYRGVLRALGIHLALSSGSHRPEIVMVDEGTVSSAHAILAHVAHAPRAEDVDAFARLVPMPDRVVLVTAPIDAVLARTLKRRDPPMSHRSLEDRERFLRNAHAAFERLRSHASLSRNTLRLVCDDDSRHRYGAYAREILEYIAC
jgi:thymidylate kinase